MGAVIDEEPAYPPDGDVDWRPPVGRFPDLAWERDAVLKTFPAGAEADRARELAVLQRLGHILPIPEALPTRHQAAIRMAYAPGVTGHHWLLHRFDGADDGDGDGGDGGGDGGDGDKVGEVTDERPLRLVRQCGAALLRLHRLGRDVLAAELSGSGQVIVHGDFAPYHLIVDNDSGELRAVLGWDRVHLGSEIEDLAWLEWNLRIWLADRPDAVGALYAAYGTVPAWQDRHRVMLDRCRPYAQRAERTGYATELSARWAGRMARTRAFCEIVQT